MVSWRVGLPELEKLLRATKRQIVVRANLQSYEKLAVRLVDVERLMDSAGFDCICFSRREGHGNMVIGNRRGAGGKLVTVPPLVLMPTETVRDHPCLRGAHIGSYADFS